MRPPPPKCAPLSGSLATSSQRDVLTAGHSKLLLSSEAATEERDEYLMRLLRKGAPPAGVPLAPPPVQAPQGAPPPVLQQQATQAQSQQAAEAPRFRAPGPVSRSVPPSVPAPASATPPASSPSRLLPRATSTTLASPSSTAGAGTGMGGATVPSLPLPTPSATATTTDQAVPTSAGGTAAGTPTAPPPRAAPLLPPHARAAAAGAPAAAPLAVPQLVAVPPDLAATFDQTRRMLGDEIALSVRDTMIRQQVMFLEQLYDLHRAIAIQKLLMQNCPEVQQVMGEAMRLMSSVGSQHGSGSGRGSKRQRTTPNGGATVPGSGSGDPSSFRPDSQFAAVPQLPGEAQTRDDEDDDGGSGDANGSGSAGANGSGGGSTSPQQAVPGMPPPPPLPYMYLAHTAVATPSGASAAPVGWQWGMAPLGQGQVQQLQQATGLPPVPRGPPQMAPWVGQDAGLAAVGINTHSPQHLKHAAGAAGGKPSKTATAATAPPAPRATPPRPAPAQPSVPAPAPAAALPTQPHLVPQPQPQPPQASPAVAQAPLPAPVLVPPPPASLAMPPPGVPPPMPFGPPPPHMMMGPPGPAGLPCPAPGAADPMAWWYQNYYGSQQQMGGMSLATAQAAAAAAAAFMQQAQQQPGGTGCATTAPHGTAGATGTGAGTVTKWWHDPQLTFGPPVDTEMLARWPVGGPAALLAREGPEVQSAPAGQLKRPADSRRRSSMPYSDGPRMRLKRKATADADEASSGTTGHTHEPDGGAGTTAGGPFKRHESLRARSARTSPQGPAAASGDPMGGGGQDENAAQLLLAIGKQ